MRSALATVPETSSTFMREVAVAPFSVVVSTRSMPSPVALISALISSPRVLISFMTS